VFLDAWWIGRSLSLPAAVAVCLAACGSVELADESPAGDSGESEAALGVDGGHELDAVFPDGTSEPVDTAVPKADTGIDPPADAPLRVCSSTPRALDPDATLDPSIKGPLPIATKTVTIPMLGPLTNVKVKVTYPTASDGSPHAGRHAWVMFHHAVHGPYPGVVYDDYPTLHGHWASHGLYVFSIDGSRIFFPTTMGTTLTFAQQQTVANMMSDAITYFVEQQERSSADFPCRLDADRVAISGHSRGGGATLLVPTARGDGARIKGLLSFQGVDPGTLAGAEGYVFPGFELPAIWFDAALDGDVIYPYNALQYGRTRNFGAMVTILGSKHTFTFDANALPDQGGTAPTITPAEHKAVCVQYSTAFLRALVRDGTATAADADRLRGPGGLASTKSSGGILYSFRPAKTTSFITKFDDVPGTTTIKTEAGGAIVATGAMTATPFETHSASVASLSTNTRRVSREVLSLQLQWTSAGGALEVPLAASVLSSRNALVFDLSMPSEGLTSGTTPLELEIRDSTGATVTLSIKDYLGSAWFTRPRRLATAYVPLAKLTGIDPAKATVLRIVARSGVAAGIALVDSLRVE